MDLVINGLLFIIGMIIGTKSGISRIWKLVLVMFASYIPLRLIYSDLKLWGIDMYTNDNIYNFLKSELALYGLISSAIIYVIFYLVFPRVFEKIMPKKMESKIKSMHDTLTVEDTNEIKIKVGKFYKGILSIIFWIDRPKKKMKKKDWDITYSEILEFYTTFFSSLILVIFISAITLSLSIILVLIIGTVLCLGFIILLRFIPFYRHWSVWLSEVWRTENNKLVIEK